MFDYDSVIARMNDWTVDAEAWDRHIADEAAEDARRDAARHDAMAAEREDFELALAAEIRDMAASRHGGPPDSHDAALALAAVCFRFGRPVDHEAKQAALSADPEPIDYRPAGHRSAEASVNGGQIQRRVGPPADDRAFGDRLAALADEGEALVRLRRRARGRAVVPTTTERSLRTILASIDRLVGPDGAPA